MTRLTYSNRAVILSLVTSRFKVVTKRTMSDYHEKMMAMDYLVCYRCRDEIQLGQEYHKTYSKSSGSKYYHYSCYDSLLL